MNLIREKQLRELKQQFPVLGKIKISLPIVISVFLLVMYGFGYGLCKLVCSQYQLAILHGGTKLNFFAKLAKNALVKRPASGDYIIISVVLYLLPYLLIGCIIACLLLTVLILIYNNKYDKQMDVLIENGIYEEYLELKNRPKTAKKNSDWVSVSSCRNCLNCRQTWEANVDGNPSTVYSCAIKGNVNENDYNCREYKAK